MKQREYRATYCITRIFLLMFLLFCIMSYSSAEALTVSYDINYEPNVTYYNPEDWQHLLEVEFPGSGPDYRPNDDRYGVNCIQFVRRIVSDDGVYLPRYSDTGADTYLRTLPSWETETNDKRVAQILNSHDVFPTSRDLKYMFSLAKPRDVIQMRWTGTQHTALVSGVTDKGVWYFEAHNAWEDTYNGKKISGTVNGLDVSSINNHFYDWETLAKKYKGNDKGVTIYRYIVDISNDTFPDETFRKYVMNNFDTNKDGKLVDEEIQAVKDINLQVQYLANVKGIEIFTSLKEFRYEYTHLDRSVSPMRLSEVNLSRNLKLESVYIHASEITELDLSNHKALKTIYCTSNPNLSKLNVKGCTALESLRCYIHYNDYNYHSPHQYAYLKELDLRDCVNLWLLECPGNELVSLDLSNNVYLNRLNCNNNYITTLKIDNCKNLRSLNCHSNRLDSLNVSMFPKLSTLYCEGNNLRELDVTNNPQLSWLSCQGNHITVLDLSNNPQLSPTFEGGYWHHPGFGQRIAVPENRIVNNQYNLSEIISSDKLVNVISAGIKAYDNAGEEIETKYDSNSGNVSFASYPYRLTYSYDTGYFGEWRHSQGIMNVTVYFADKPKITTQSLNNAPSGKYYYLKLSAEGTQPITWSASGLPSNLSLNSTTGEIRGTPSYALDDVGTYDVTITASNPAGNDTKTFALVVGDYTSKSPAQIMTSTIPAAKVNQDYSAQLEASGSTPVTWSLISANSNLSNLKVSSSGLIECKPSKAGNFQFKVRASNSAGYDEKFFMLTVIKESPSGIPVITTNELTTAFYGEPYSFTLEAESSSSIASVQNIGGIITGLFKWILQGTLPKGLKLDNSGIISGTPTKAGNFSFTVKATDSSKKTGKKKLSLKVVRRPEIKTAKFNKGTSCTHYNYILKGEGTSPLIWNASGLPEGLTINQNNGKISGKTTKSGTFNVTVSLSNNYGNVQQSFLLTIKPKMPNITTSSLPKGKALTPYSVSLKASGTEPMTWTASDLPEGLSINKDTGVISGTVPKVWNGKVTVAVSNGAGTKAKKMNMRIEGKAPNITMNELPNAVMGRPYESEINYTGDPEITLNVTKLPKGLSFSSGKITGTPAKAGKYYVTVKAKNIMKTVSKRLQLIVAEPPKIKTSSLLTYKAGTTFSFTLKASGTSPLTWEVSGLPSGLSLNKATVKGKTNETGTFTLKVKVSNAAGSDEKELYLRVESRRASYKEDGTHNENESVIDEYASDDEIQIIREYDYSSVLTMNDDEYIIAAVLPEIKVNESGIYDFGAVLSSDIETGRKLVWLANSESPSEDDNIAEFYDEDGGEIKTVPDNHNISVSVWLNEGIVYKPVIAVGK